MSNREGGFTEKFDNIAINQLGWGMFTKYRVSTKEF